MGDRISQNGAEKQEQGHPSFILSYKIVALAVSFLALLYMFHKQFSIDIAFMEPIISLIEDARGFLTITCISYILTGCLWKFHLEGNPLYTVAYAASIVLLNQLYSNRKWVKIYEAVIKIKWYNWIYILVVLAGFGLVIFFIAKAVRKKKIEESRKREEERTNSYLPRTASPNEEDEILSFLEKKHNYSPNLVGRDDKSGDSSMKEPGERLSRIISYTLSISAGLVVSIACLVLTVYFINKTDFWNLNYSDFELFLTTLITIGVFVFSIFIGFVAFSIVRKLNVDRKADGALLTAPLACILEIAYFYLMKKDMLGPLNDNIFDNLASNTFAFIVYGVIIFVIFQILITLFINLCFPNFFKERKNEIAELLEERVSEIEVAIVKLACDLISGVLDLFQFVPGFFDKIGVLLLGNAPKKGSKAKANRPPTKKQGTNKENGNNKDSSAQQCPESKENK